MTKPKGTPEERLANKIYTHTQNVMGKIFKKYSKEQKPVVKVEPPKKPEPQSEETKKIVDYLKGHTQAFGCNRPDVLNVLSIVLGEDLNSFLTQPPTPFTPPREGYDEYDDNFVQAYNDTKCAGIMVVSVNEDGEDREFLLLTDAENDYYFDKNSCNNNYDNWENTLQVRLPTLDEVKDYVNTVGINELKKWIALF